MGSATSKKTNIMWSSVNLSSIESVRGLIKFRYKFDKIVYNGIEYYPDIFDEEIFCTYSWLDSVIEQCDFNDKQLEVLDLHMMQGYTEREIAEWTDTTQQNINGVLGSICKKIYDNDQLNWKYNYYFMVKARCNWEYKKCSGCGEYKPATDDFFQKQANGLHGYKPKCKICTKGGNI